MIKDILIYAVVLVCLIPVAFVLFQFSFMASVVFILAVLISVITIAKPVFLVYFWAVIGPLSTVVQGIEILPGIQQSLYGALNLFIFPALILITILYFQEMKKGLKFLAPFSFLVPLTILAGILAGNLRTEHFRDAVGLAIFFLIGAVAFSFIKTKKDLLRLCYVIAAPALLICLSAIVDMLFFQQFSRMDRLTLRPGTFTLPNPSYLCLFALVILGISTAYFKVTEDFLEKLVWATFISISALTVLFSFSLSGWISALAFLVVFLAMKSQTYRWLRITLGFLILIQTVLLIQVLRIHELPQFNYIRTGGSFGFRYRIWNATLKLIAQKPLVGHSIDAGANLQAELGTTITSAHNIFLSYLMIFGLIGTLGIIWTFWRIGRQLVRMTHSSDSPFNFFGVSLLAVLASIIVIGGAHSIGFDPSYFLVFWLISLGTIGAYAHQTAESSPTGQS